MDLALKFGIDLQDYYTKIRKEERSNSTNNHKPGTANIESAKGFESKLFDSSKGKYFIPCKILNKL